MSMSPSDSAVARGMLVMPKMKERLLVGSSRLSAGLARVLARFGPRAAAPAERSFSKTRLESLAVAVTFKKMGDTALRSSDLVHPGEHYVAAIRLYGDALACLAGIPTARAGDVPEGSAGGVAPTCLQRALAQDDLLAARVRTAMAASVNEIVAIAGGERQSLALAMQKVCAAAIGDNAADSDRIGYRELNRYLRLVAAVLTVVGISSLATQYWAHHGDVALNKPWRASSELLRCRPINKGGCPSRQGIFFHTNQEENPWIEYDLGKRTEFSSVTVENARDGFRDRAVPLIVEIGDDQKIWSEVARTTRPFEVWNATFPFVSARYVRFRVPHVTYLHLAKIEIHK